MRSMLAELRRRNVFRVGGAYIVVGWLVLQVADTLGPGLSLPDWVQPLVMFLLILGFPVALVLAWAFELTPDGLIRESDSDRSEAPARAGHRKVDLAIIVLLAAIVAYLAYDRFASVPDLGAAGDVATSTVAEKSVAVLPFVAMSNGEDDDYFADGLTEEILNSLAQLPELQVTARTSSFFFKDQNLPAPEIAARLDVAHVVEGSVRRAGERVRITAQLIRATDDVHLWSQTYDRTLEDVFAVQEDIAESIAAVLDVVLDDRAREAMRSSGIGDVDAFIAWQKGLEAYAAAHTQLDQIAAALAAANVYFDQALAAAPDLAEARVLKADLAGHIVFDLASGVRQEAYPGEAREALIAVREEADSASNLSPPGNQRDILALERALFLDDWSSVPALIENAMQPAECPQLNWTSEFISAFGFADQVAEKFRETLICDPVSFIASNFLPLNLVWAGEPEAALRELERSKEIGVTHPWLEDAHFTALLAAGRLSDPFVRMPQPSSSALPFDRRILIEALTGDPEVARQQAQEYWSAAGVDDWSSLMLAAIVGDRGKANELAARIDARPGGALPLASLTFNCFCGALFDLDATPNFRARIEEAGFIWPPREPIDYPTKTW